MNNERQFFSPRSCQKVNYSYKTLRTVYHPEGFCAILCNAYMIPWVWHMHREGDSHVFLVLVNRAAVGLT